MAAQGSGGAYEISQRMTAMVGWGATANFSEVGGARGRHAFSEKRAFPSFWM